MIISLGPFAGIAPGVNAYLLPEDMAQTAENCDFRFGDLRPLRGTSVLSDTSDNRLLSCFYYNGVWRAWRGYVDVILSPVANANKRAYATGVTSTGPIEFDATIATTALEPVGYTLGIPAPTGAVSVALGAGGGCAVADQTSVTFLYTFLSTWGGVTERGPPSPASAVADPCDGQTVTLSGFSSAPAGNYNITHRRIYGRAGNSYLLLADIPIADSSYEFAFSVDGFDTDVLPSTDWPAPPSDMVGIIRTANGIGIGFRNNEIIISEPYQLHAYPEAYRLSTDYPIRSLLPIGNAIAVLTEGYPYLLEGISSPESMQLRRLENYQACAARRSAVDFGDYGMYAGTDGLVLIAPTGEARVVTSDYYTPEQWRTLVNPSSIRGFNWKGTYVGFYSVVTAYTYMRMNSRMNTKFDHYTTTDGGLMFDQKTKGIRLLSFTSFGGQTVADTFSSFGNSTVTAGMLAILRDGDIVEFASDSAAYLTATWKSKKFRLPSAKSFGAGQVLADAYPVTFKVYADGALKHTQTVSSSLPFRLPGGFRATDWELQIETSNIVRKAFIAESMSELAAV